MKNILLIVFANLLPLLLFGESDSRLVPVANGWSNNSVNVAVFRKNSLVTAKGVQFVSFYDAQGFVVLGKRNVGDTTWTLHKTQHSGKASDAHNVISIMVDGDGYLHMSWDHHGNRLNYAVSREPYSLDMGEKQEMTGIRESNVTYPEFYKMPSGNLLFIYRDGASGRGNIALKQYNTAQKQWSDIHENLITGEGKRNAYWQSCLDANGVLHLSWVWRETPDVATNHNICYAQSKDGGKTWCNSKGESYALPITKSSGEVAWQVEKNSELINQTSMTTDSRGRPYIATYWREQQSSVPQYRVVYSDGEQWKSVSLNSRTTPFSLSGGGTKSIPISRPQLVVAQKGSKQKLQLIFRDVERGSKVSVATCNNLKKGAWSIKDYTDFSVGSWEPTFDTELWRERQQLHIFVQNATQIDGEGYAEVAPNMVYVLEIK